MDALTVLGRYRLVQKVGEGGMGVVHLALDPEGRTVAVKVLRAHVAADPHARERLAREVSSLQRVRHPRVAEVIDADTDGEQPFVVTRYVPAPALDDMVRLDGPLRGADLARLGDGLGEALAAIHAAGVVHRDLKPGNVLMLDGDPVVIDFGIAHVADDVRLTSTGLVMGTPGYLSPEVLDGHRVSQATDWWGWAATMAFAATGRPPFGRGPLEAVLDRVRRGTVDLDGVPGVLVPALRQALAVEPAARPAPPQLRLAVGDLWQQTRVPVPSERPAEPVTQVIPTAARRQDADVTAALATPGTRLMPAQPTPPQRAYPVVPDRDPWAPAPVEAGHAEHPAAPAPLPRSSRNRRGVLAAGLVTTCATAAVVPVVTALAGALWMVVARTVHRSHATVLRRRYEYGPRRSDVIVGVAASPWHFVMAVLSSAAALVLPLLVAVSTVFVVGLVVGSGGPQPGQAVPLAAGALGGVLTAWWGPGGGSLRRGSRTLARSLTPGRAGQLLAVALLALVTVAAMIVVVRNGGQPDWAPLPGPPLGVGSPVF